jgi:hypothetical protein
MGMEFKIEQITPQQLADFIQNPSSAYEYVLAESFENPAVGEFLKMIAVQRQSLTAEQKANIARLASLLPAMSAENGGGLQLLKKKLTNPKRNNSKTQSEHKQLFLEKHWHVLHYALNGTAEGGEGPVADAVLGLREIPDHEGVMGYGPLRYLTSEEVRAVAKVLDAVSPKQLLSRLDKQDAEKKRIYLAHTFDHPEEWEYLPELFVRFRDFYRDASMQGNAMLMVMY